MVKSVSFYLERFERCTLWKNATFWPPCILGCFLLVLLSFVVFGLVSSVLSEEIGWEERLHYDLFCIEWDVKH